MEGLMGVEVPALQTKVEAFVNEHVIPSEAVFMQQQEAAGPAARWTSVPPVIEELKAKAKAAGLWNLFLPAVSKLSQLQYAPLAEIMGRSPLASEAFNCSAPDTGNMEVLHLYGSPEQKAKWLQPLLDGKIRSCFCMTEPQVASSDATNIETTISRDGDSYIVNGVKWWSSGAGDPRCKVAIVMGRTENNDMPRHKQHSMILVPMDTPGVRKIRPLQVFGYDDAPHGHFEVAFDNVRVPAANLILGEGRGFEIAQGRLGPGRIHHCMRLIGVAERCLELMCARAATRKAFGKELVRHGSVLQDIAQSRLDIDAARLVVLRAAYLIDTKGTKMARAAIGQAKIMAPIMACTVADRAIQVHGGAGVCQDFPLSYAYVMARTLRIADGPDEVHLASLGKDEMYRQQAKL